MRRATQGQSIASTTRGNNTGNPFGIFDSSIFNGANVIKSFTADTPSGGLAAVVDLRIAGALRRKEGAAVRVELGYEETTEDINPSYFAQFAKKLTDNFGVYAIGAYSDQSFRRDTVRINGYSEFTQQVTCNPTVTPPPAVGANCTAGVTTPARQQQLFPDIPLADANGVRNEVVYPDEIRQFALSNVGYRFSSAAGLEWRPASDLSIRVDGIFTRRDLKEANLDIFSVSPSDENGVVTPLVDPVFVGLVDRDNTGTATNVFLVSDITASDVSSAVGNRSNPALDQAWAVYPQINWENDSWKVNLVGTYSKAIGEEKLTQYDVRIREIRPNNATRRVPITDAEGRQVDGRGNGVFATIRTGAGNFDNYFLDAFFPTDLLDFAPRPDAAVANQRTYSLSGGNTIQATVQRAFIAPDGLPQTTGLTFTAAAGDNRVERDLKAIDFDVERNLNFGPFTSVGVGGFYSKENATKVFAENSGIGLRFGNLTSGALKLNDAVTSGGDFFGGTLPGAERDSFFSLDLDAVNNALLPVTRDLTETGTTFNPSAANKRALFPELNAAIAQTVTPDELTRLAPVNPLSGTLQRFPLRRVAGRNYDSDRETIELYAQTKFDLSEMYPGIRIRGNFGLRYIKTDLGGLVNDPSFGFYQALAADRDARIAAGETGITPINFRDDGSAGASFRPGAFAAAQPASAEFKAWLPSANLIVKLTDDLVMRAAYYETFEAIDLAEFSPAQTTIVSGVIDLDDIRDSTPQTQITVSSLDILPRSSKAFDVGISWYNRPGSVISLGYFHKTLENDISRNNNFCPQDQSFSIGDFNSGPLNNVNGRCEFINSDTGNVERIRIRVSLNNPNSIDVDGFEFQIQQNFDFIDIPIIKNMGGVFNYTRVRSSGGGGTQLFNVAEDTYNIIGYYEKDWLQMRLAYNRQSAIQREGGASFSGSSTFSAPYGQLDFSGAIRPNKNFEVRFEVFNILNERREEYVGFEELGQLVSYDGRTYGVSTTLKF